MAQPHSISRDPTPRYLRFAQALALVSGLAAPGCALDHTRGDDTGPLPDGGTDAFVADAGSDTGVDAPYIDPCSRCECVFGGDMPPPPGSCEAAGTPECCYLVGPLSPPDLPA